MPVNNSEFKIINKCKEFSLLLDDILENVQRKDMYYKDKLREKTINLIKMIYEINNESDITKIKEKDTELKSIISTIDFLLERLYKKKYIGEKSLEKITVKLIEINKMSNVWIKNILEYASKNKRCI